MEDLSVTLDEVTGVVIVEDRFGLIEIKTLEELELLQAMVADAVHTIRSRNCSSYDVQRHKAEPLCCWNGKPDSCEYCAANERP